MTDNAGTVQTEYTYEPFGNTTVSGASNSSSYQYTGRENDGTGLYYYRARYYHPGLQRFISEDQLNAATVQIPTTALSPTLANTIKSLTRPPRSPVAGYSVCEIASGTFNPKDQSLAAFLSKGPAVLHPYAYAGNDPLLFIDPLGYDVMCGLCRLFSIVICPLSAEYGPPINIGCLVINSVVCAFCDPPPPPPPTKSSGGFSGGGGEGGGGGASGSW